MKQKSNSETPFRNTLCLIKIHTLVEIPSRTGRWELSVSQIDWCVILVTSVMEFFFNFEGWGGWCVNLAMVQVHQDI